MLEVSLPRLLFYSNFEILISKKVYESKHGANFILRNFTSAQQLTNIKKINQKRFSIAHCYHETIIQKGITYLVPYIT